MLAFIRLRGVMVDLEAPGSNEKVLCERCFAFVDSKAESCPECGAPMGNHSVVEAEAELHPQLAQANVLRMRGEFKQASDICLGILRRYPNNGTANTILGDIAMSRGEFEQAVEWYELALDINPDSKDDREKLEGAKAQIKAAELAHTNENLNLPGKSFPWAAIAAVLGIISIVAIGIVVFQSRQAPPKPISNTPIVVGDLQVPNNDLRQSPENKSSGDHILETTRSLADEIADMATLPRDRVRSFAVDVKDRSIRIGVVMLTEDPEWKMLVRLVNTTLERDKDAPAVHIDVYRSNQRTSSHTILRTTYEQTLTEEWKQANPSPEISAIPLYFPESLKAPAVPGAPEGEDLKNNGEVPTSEGVGIGSAPPSGEGNAVGG